MKLSSLFIAISTFLTVSPAFAAKFTPVQKMKSTAAEQLSQVSCDLFTNDDTLGDASSVLAFSFVRKEGEKDINTVKQLNFAKGGLYSEDSGADSMQKMSAEKLVDHLFEAIDNNNDAAFREAREDLTEALKAVKADRNLKIFGANHADEDGSWQILDILDVRDGQVLILKVGYRGT